MRKVLAVINTPTFGGPHNQLCQLQAPLRKLGWEYIAAVPKSSETDAMERLRAARVDVVAVPLHRLRGTRHLAPHVSLIRNFASDIRSLERVMTERGISVVQVCGTMNLQPAIAARRHGIGIVWQLLSTFAPAPIRAVLSPYIGRAADVVMSTGERIAEAHYGLSLSAKRILTFLPPVDTTSFAPSVERRLAARRELGIPDDAFLVGTVGNFNRQKGHERMVQAFPSIQRRMPNAYLRILGSVTPSQQELYGRVVLEPARAMGLMNDGKLDFVSPSERVRELLPAFDVFLLTSHAEGIPTAMLEAMACGVPVVSTSVGGIPEVVRDGVNGFILSDAKPETIASKIAMILENPSLQVRLQEAARQTALESFSLEACAALHAGAFAEALHS